MVQHYSPDEALQERLQLVQLLLRGRLAQRDDGHLHLRRCGRRQFGGGSVAAAGLGAS